MTTSPCVKTCTLDPSSGLCVGCGRTIDEIARWAAMSEAERIRVLDELPARRATKQILNSASRK